MSDTTTSGDRRVGAGAATPDELNLGTGLSVNAPESIEPPRGTVHTVVGRSPGQLAWMRLRRDRVAVASSWVLITAAVIVLAAPLIQWLYGDDAEHGHSELLDGIGYPLGISGGVSGDHWLGITPARGYDLVLQIVFGMRTSLGIAVVAAIASVAFGVLVGATAGFLGGWIDRALVWLTDFMLAFPFFLFAIALVPALSSRLADQYGEVATWKRIAVIVTLFTVFGWMTTARIVRGQVISLREREYVEAARAAGAGTGHMLFRQILPNVWAPILVIFSLVIPANITLEAALSFLSIGIQEPTPDLGRLIQLGASNASNFGLVPWMVFVPAVTLFVLVLAFNLLGDAVRDALDPKSSR